MLVDLALLLRDRQVCHPSRITAAVLKDRNLQVRIAGWPWWNDNAGIGRDHGIKLIFRGVGEGILELWDFDSENNRALERFSVIASDDLPWAQPNGSAIYCSTPLPKPLNIYLGVNDFLASHGAFRRGEQYLNCLDNEELTTFVKITQASSYLLGQFPPAIRDIVCAELDTQKVHYSELPCVFEKTGQLLVTIQRSQFFCETAEALFEI
jgi:hypothetical protein